MREHEGIANSCPAMAAGEREIERERFRNQFSDEDTLFEGCEDALSS